MKTFEFKNRLFLAYAAMTIGIVLLFGVLLIGMTSAQNRETELLHQQEVFDGNLRQIDAMLTQAERLASQVSTNNEVLSLFIALDEPGNRPGGGDNYFSDQLIDTIRVDSLLSGLNGVDGFADRISVFNRYGDYVSTGRLYETTDRIAQTLKNVRWIDRLIEKVQAQPDHFLVSGFHKDEWSDNPNASFLSIYKAISYTGSSMPYGLVSVQIQADRLRDLEFWLGAAQGTEYFMIDDTVPSAPRPVYPSALPVSIYPVYDLVAGQLARMPRGDLRVICLDYSENGTDYKLLASRLSSSNWVFLRALPVAELTRPYFNNYIVMVLGCLAMMVLFLFIVNYMAERISRPLRVLAESIGGVNLQNMRMNSHVTRHDYSTRELIALDDAFRSMLSRLDDSIELEMQAYMTVLQSQMNPHFLYNMLSVIIASSESAGDEKTVSMCLKLTAMLRYIADFSRDRVPIRDEIEHARNYLNLMKERYEDLFSFDIRLDERAASQTLPKLTVQPLVENCFMHGFESSPPWHVSIEAAVRDGRWCLVVEDNGVGMTEEAIRALNARIEAYREDVAGTYKELKLGGMGLVNTLLRLSIVSDAPVAYSIGNRPEGGLRIEIGGMIDDPGDDC